MEFKEQVNKTGKNQFLVKLDPNDTDKELQVNGHNETTGEPSYELTP